MAELVHGELADRVGDLSVPAVSGQRSAVRRRAERREDALAEDGQEARVQPGDAFLAREAHEPGREPRCVAALRDEAYARRLERRQQDVSKEPARTRSAQPGRGRSQTQMQMHALGDAGRAEVDGGAVADGGLLAAGDLDELLLPVFVAGELGAALDEVADGGGPEAGEERGGALVRDDEAAAGEEGVALERGVDLDAGLDDVNRCGPGTVSRVPRGQNAYEDDVRVMPPCVTLRRGQCRRSGAAAWIHVRAT